ncbi:transporter substrate-binding domain-containing protein [Roseateles saccharophilus]|uniref:Amino acid ABC transporter substrate-binding protein (PAAT family) n=1 Tax=Roseateles saccharophilus TaxID=304 RepID=A0A4R3V5V2_ROSSA|nr:transporter substrate-binding domain-containing protein [Roseateles saccharophilus]MDG0832579.1 transporter substrate-binding domain-containing protein [Roseateles saccharophilus]TCV00316.1 amino acid ABC transporter substrate-binding protein (PAAT family) [Roseateles saccharophilus]
MRRRSAFAAATLALAGTALAQPPQRLRIGFAVGYAPFSEVGSDGQLQGFEIDLARALCERLQLQCLPVILDFDGLIPALQSRKIDAIMASMAITIEREQVIAFTSPYYYSPARMIAARDSRLNVSPSGLRGKRIGVERGTVHERFLGSVFKDSQIVRYGTQDQVFLDLKSGRLDAALADAAIAEFGFLNKPDGRGFGFIGPDFREPQYFGKGIGIGLRQADAAGLGRHLDEALAALRGSGALKALNDRYFGIDLVSPPH